MDNKYTGRNGIASAILYYTRKNYTISIPLNDTQWYDLIVEKDNKFITVQCKATTTKENGISLRSCGGNNGKTHYYAQNTPIDIIFCLDKNNYVYEIPMEDIKKYGVKYFITLKPKKTNSRGFPSYKYCKGKL